MYIENLSNLITGRQCDLFLPDLKHHREKIHDSIFQKRILVVGGAGSIGMATIRALISFKPLSLHVIDHNENNLVELVRDLRSSYSDFPVKDFRALPLDFGSTTMFRFLSDNAPYDLILTFAALKHVRSEKDAYSLLQMLETNIIKSARFFSWVSGGSFTKRFFFVSSDKAANPVNLMGASKLFLEKLIFSTELRIDSRPIVTSARFSNVAFSEGSLFYGFLKRLEKRQPLAVPRETRRYFITLPEAGEICLLAAASAPDRHLLIPRLNPDRDLIDLQSAAEKILRYHGFEPRIYEDELEVKNNLGFDLKKGQYPLLLTPLDTSGEKPYEEFAGAGERVIDIGMSNLLGIEYIPYPEVNIMAFLNHLEELILHPEIPIEKKQLIQLISEAVPQLRHVETGKNLDDRM